jgi:hypothetical protein
MQTPEAEDASYRRRHGSPVVLWCRRSGQAGPGTGRDCRARAALAFTYSRPSQCQAIWQQRGLRVQCRMGRWSPASRRNGSCTPAAIVRGAVTRRGVLDLPTKSTGRTVNVYLLFSSGRLRLLVLISADER